VESFRRRFVATLPVVSDIHQQLPTVMADIRLDWLADQNTDCCFVAIGLVQDIPQSFALHLKIDQVGPPSLLASNGGQRIFINIHAQYGIQKNVYIHPWYE